ncbi:hypothetical protein GCM10016455_03370 [Aliiroseovarius zhejiangensis]|uniref:HTH merR-type domain-containing protein n=1 Tax=Aliiroseovarius zhejiangensis TaxID=1632025 RepID=A0ABQ3IPD5_9RHOB|nr:MerR family transcriptional regulator [Aliiroseovarius zhejiangensis]GHE86983.1 hypothetical protein GCM10016455_03370 [Aliiroseovarius zhejiangensis]
MDKKSPDAFRTISEVAEWLGVPTHVLRFWESRFSQVKPVKRAGGRRYYRPNDMELLGGIRKLLHEDGMTIRGVQKLLREEGIKHVAGMSPPLDSDEMRDITPSNVVPLAEKRANGNSSDDVPMKAERADAPSAEPEQSDPSTSQTPSADEAPPETVSPETASSDPASGTPAPTVSTPPASSQLSDKTEVPHHEEASHTAPEQPDDAANLPETETETGSQPEADVEPPFTRGDVGDAQDERPAPLPDAEPEPQPEPRLFASARTAPDTAHAGTEGAPELPGLQDDPESHHAPDAPTASSAPADAPAPSPVETPPAPRIDISHIPADPGDDDATPPPPLTAALRQARKSGTRAHIPALQALADRLESLAAQMNRDPGPTP